MERWAAAWGERQDLVGAGRLFNSADFEGDGPCHAFVIRPKPEVHRTAAT